MKKIKILLTATGAPGCSTLIRKLRDNGERDTEIIAADMKNEVIGAAWGDRFYKLPPADDAAYIQKLMSIVEKEKPDVLFPVSSAEGGVVSSAKTDIEAMGTRVLISDAAALQVAQNKQKVYEVLKKNGIPGPDFRLVDTLDDFISSVRELGYPQKTVCFKPPVAKGSRGFRILDDSVSRRDLLMNHKPESVYMSLDEFISIFRDELDFPEMLVMEHMEGVHYDAMCLCLDGDALLTTVKTREESRWGIITLGQLVDNNELVKLVSEIIHAIPLSYNIGLQFIGNKLVEINPRQSTFIYQSDLNEPYLAVKLCLGELTPDEVRSCQKNVRIGRRMIRYMDQIFWDKELSAYEN